MSTNHYPVGQYASARDQAIRAFFERDDIPERLKVRLQRKLEAEARATRKPQKEVPPPPVELTRINSIRHGRVACKFVWEIE